MYLHQLALAPSTQTPETSQPSILAQAWTRTQDLQFTGLILSPLSYLGGSAGGGFVRVCIVLSHYYHLPGVALAT